MRAALLTFGGALSRAGRAIDPQGSYVEAIKSLPCGIFVSTELQLVIFSFAFVLFTFSVFLFFVVSEVERFLNYLAVEIEAFVECF